MKKILLVTNPYRLETPTIDYTVVGLEETLVDSFDIFCAVPSKDIPKGSKYNLLFIPYSRENDWNYKQFSRALRYKLGEDKCEILDTTFSYPIHKQVQLSYNEEVHLLILVIEFFLEQKQDIILSHKIDLGSDKQNLYLEKLINENKIQILNE